MIEARERAVNACAIPVRRRFRGDGPDAMATRIFSGATVVCERAKGIAASAACMLYVPSSKRKAGVRAITAHRLDINETDCGRNPDPRLERR
jgi:hypothetical protein